MFRIDSGITRGYFMSFSLLKVYVDGLMKEIKIGLRRTGSKIFKEIQRMEIICQVVFR